MALGLLVGCAPDQPQPAANAGTLDVSRYLSVGDGYAAGFSNGGLTRTGQENSFPALLARQLQRVGTTAFDQPLLAAGTGTDRVQAVSFNADGTVVSARVPGSAVRNRVFVPTCTGRDSIQLLNQRVSGTLPRQLAVPGLLVRKADTVGYGNEAQARGRVAFNPFFERLLPAGDNRSYLQTVATAAPNATFFTYFAGMDDVLTIVQKGGACGSLPPTNQVNQRLSTPLNNNTLSMLRQLTANNGAGVVGLLPALNTLPLLRLGNAVRLQLQLQRLENDTTARIYIRNGVLGTTNSAAADDYILATSLRKLGRPTTVTVNGQSLTLPYGRDARAPLQNADVLDYREYSLLNGVFTSYNTFINGQITAARFPRVAIAQVREDVFDKISNGLAYNGIVYGGLPVQGGLFSADYYSLTPRGNALLANSFIKALNDKFDANIPFLDPNSLPVSAE